MGVAGARVARQCVLVTGARVALDQAPRFFFFFWPEPGAGGEHIVATDN